jgi:hypothetical protein
MCLRLYFGLCLRAIIGIRNGLHRCQDRCPAEVCAVFALGTRFTTLSYGKVLGLPLHEGSSGSAEHLLRVAKAWMFTGCGFPVGDYEFSVLLIHVQLSRLCAPKTVLMPRGIREAADRTEL